MIDREIVWTETAEFDLDHIASYMANDDIASAPAVLERIRGRRETLAKHAERGREVPELRAVEAPSHPELIEGPRRILYRYDERLVFIVSVLDARRDLSSLLIERLVHDHATPLD